MRILCTTGLTPLHVATGLLLGAYCISPANGQASFQGLGFLPPGGFIESGAADVSADGLVVVGFGRSPLGWIESFRWTREGGMVGLGYLPGSFPSSHAHGVSDDGSVVVGNSFSAASDPEAESYRWTVGGGMIGLGDLPGGPLLSWAGGVSSDGSVVVGFGWGASGLEA